MHFIFRRVFDDNGLIINKVTLNNDAPQPPYFHMTIPDMSHEIDHRNIEGVINVECIFSLRSQCGLTYPQHLRLVRWKNVAESFALLIQQTLLLIRY